MCQSLGLNTLRSVNEQNRTFHSLERARTSYGKSMWLGVSMRLRMKSWSPSLYFILTGCIFMVIPLSRSSSIESRTCSCILCFSIVPVIQKTIGKVLLPWSMWAIIEKFLICVGSMNVCVYYQKKLKKAGRYARVCLESKSTYENK